MPYTSNLSKEQKKELAQEKVKKAFAKTQTAVLSIFNKNNFTKYLEFAAKFHYFDVSNVLLIYMQRPNATFVAPFALWQSLNYENFKDSERAVFTTSQKGQGIAILKPYKLMKKNPEPVTQANRFKKRGLAYLDYHVEFVFDKEQTNKIPAPVCSWDLKKDRVACEATYEALKSKAPFKVVFAEADFKLNYSLVEAPGDSGERDTLLLNQNDRYDFYKLCDYIISNFAFGYLKKALKNYSSDELQKISECVSFMISSYFGLPTEDYVFFFVDSWATGNTSKMLETLNVIQTNANTLIESLEDEIAFYLDFIQPEGDGYGDSVDDYSFQTLFENF